MTNHQAFLLIEDTCYKQYNWIFGLIYSGCNYYVEMSLTSMMLNCEVYLVNSEITLIKQEKKPTYLFL